MNNSFIYKLLTWLSPSFPVSSYAYSHAFEQLIETKKINNHKECYEYLKFLLREGSPRIDIVMMYNLYAELEKKNNMQIKKIINYYQAFFPSKELQAESLFQGEALFKTAYPLWPCPELDLLKSLDFEQKTYAVVLSLLAKGHNINVDILASSYLHAFVSNLVSCAIRLIPLGQTEGQIIVSKLENVIKKTILDNKNRLLEKTGSSMIQHDIASMRHEYLPNRLFRS